MTPAALHFAAALTVIVASCASVPAPDPTDAAAAEHASIVEGRRLAEINCASCHAIGRSGVSRHPAAPPFRTLSRDYPVESLSEAFAEGILVGHRDMPEFRLEPNQIEAILDYMESVQERRAG